MKKRVLSALLCLCLLCALLPAAQSAGESAAPTPPPWCPEEEYCVFPGSVAYEPEYWSLITALRADAEAANLRPSRQRSDELCDALVKLRRKTDSGDPGILLEYGLIEFKYKFNGGGDRYPEANNAFTDGSWGQKDTPAYHDLFELWYWRTMLTGRDAPESVMKFLGDSGITLEQFWDCELLGAYSVEEQEEFLRELAALGCDTAGLQPHPVRQWAVWETTGTPVTPAAPAWCPADEYAVFPGSLAYLPGNWEKIQRLRAHVAAGLDCDDEPWPSQLSRDYDYLDQLIKKNPDNGGVAFELGLIQNKLYCNLGAWQADRVGYDYHYIRENPGGQYFLAAGNRKDITPENQYLCKLWELRGCVLPNIPTITLVKTLKEVQDNERFSMAELLDAEMFRTMPPERRSELAGLVFVRLDGTLVYPGDMDGTWTECPVQEGRTMVPVRLLSELIGAEVAWDDAAQQVKLTRGGSTVVMTLGDRRAQVDGTEIQMDAAPYAVDGKTYIPARYMAEFLGQSVTWVPEKQIMEIREDKSAAGDSNLESWVLPMGAVLVKEAHLHPEKFAGTGRADLQLRVEIGAAWQMSPNASALKVLRKSWGVTDRAGLIAAINTTTAHGHNDGFQAAVAARAAMTDAQYQQVLAQSGAVDRYMWPYTEALGEKWGDKGILAWDLFRVANLAQWGYLAGFVTYPEALALVEPAAQRLKENFTTWDEAYENYLDGYHWWAREDMLGNDVWDTPRGRTYQRLKEAEETAGIFDDGLFQREIVSVPGLSAQDIA